MKKHAKEFVWNTLLIMVLLVVPLFLSIKLLFLLLSASGNNLAYAALFAAVWQSLFMLIYLAVVMKLFGNKINALLNNNPEDEEVP